MIFPNLPVKDVAASRAFFGALGFAFNDAFSSDDTACMLVDENIMVMLLEEPRFAEFIEGEIADPSVTEVLLGLSCDSRQDVDDHVAKALAAGGSPWKAPQDHGFMYGHSFRDPDGHAWEVMWMDPAAAAGGEPGA
jgi:predicted lactoylglutathione lyase